MDPESFRLTLTAAGDAGGGPAGAPADGVVASGEGADASSSSSSYVFAAPAVPFSYPSLASKDSKGRWEKWGLSSRTCAVRLSVTRGGRDPGSEGGAFLADLFNSDALRGELAPLSASGEALRLCGSVRRVDATRLRTSCVSLDFFDALVGDGLPLGAAAPAAGGGERVVWIRKRLEEPWLGLPIVDCLREALVLPPEGDPDGEDPNGDAEALQQPNRFGGVFPPPAREEFLFRAARWVVAGGAMCQHEDMWGPYEAAVRDLARDLLTVVRDEGGGGGVRVVSQVWAVRALEGEGLNARLRGGALWPEDSPHNLCFVAFDPLHRCVHVLHSSFVPFW